MKNEFSAFKIEDLVNKDLILNQSEQLPESRREQIWNECVEKAKMLLGNYKEIRIQIVELVLKCCVVHRGGKTVEERYTVKRFARDIGIKHSTIFEWMRLREMALALTKKDQKEISFTQLTQMSKDMRGIRVNDPDFKEKMRAKYKLHKSKTPSTVRMERYLKHLKTIKYNVDNPKMIKDCEQEVLTEILSTCRAIVYELAKKDKKPKYANV